MSEFRVAEGSSSWVTKAATVTVQAAMVGIGYRLDRAYRLWLSDISPLTGPRARAEHMRIGYRERRADVSDGALVMIAVLDEIARARAMRGTR